MKVNVEGISGEHRKAIEIAMGDPVIRAGVIISGTLIPLGERARSRVISYVKDCLDEATEARQEGEVTDA